MFVICVYTRDLCLNKNFITLACGSFFVMLVFNLIIIQALDTSVLKKKRKANLCTEF